MFHYRTIFSFYYLKFILYSRANNSRSHLKGPEKTSRISGRISWGFLRCKWQTDRLHLMWETLGMMPNPGTAASKVRLMSVGFPFSLSLFSPFSFFLPLPFWDLSLASFILRFFFFFFQRWLKKELLANPCLS